MRFRSVPMRCIVLLEYGIAAHWKYKESGSGQVAAGSEEAKLSWLRQILEWQKEADYGKEFLSLIKNDLDLFSENVYCFTPSGDVKTLPRVLPPLTLPTPSTAPLAIRW